MFKLGVVHQNLLACFGTPIFGMAQKKTDNFIIIKKINCKA